MIIPRFTFLTLLTAALLSSITLAASPVRAQNNNKADGAPDVGRSLVRVNATLQSYNFIRPWEKGAPTPRRGLGAIIKGG